MRLPPSSFSLLLLCTAASLNAAEPAKSPRTTVGIRSIASRHLVLYTDLPSNPEVDRLPELFDQAVPQWADYFAIDESKAAGWQAQAYLIGDRRRFDALKLMPAGNDQFVNGISVGNRLWLYDQPTAYYRRHLLLHEGTHAFMSTFLGGCGPGWYMEGTAELFATHHLDSKTGRLTLGFMPNSRDEVPMLGRIKLIQDAFAGGKALTFPAVLQIDNRKQLDNESYAWTWAAAKWLDAHPRYQARFRALRKHVLAANFNEIVRREFADDWPELLVEWQAYVAMLDYSFDFQRTAIDFESGVPLAAGARQISIAADRGWQSLGVLLEAKKKYRITAKGRYQIAAEQNAGALQPWPCEPGGVTIAYHNGRPLGVLLGAIVDASESDVPQADQAASIVKPVEIGLACELEPDRSGTLYLRVNDSAGRLADNRGTLTVTIEPSAAANGDPR